MLCRLITSIFFCILLVKLEAQTKTADSLRSRLQKHIDNDTNRILLLNKLAYELRNDSSQRAYKYAREARALSENVNFARGIASAYGMIGLTQWSQSNLSLALKNLLTGLQLADSIHFAQAQADITGYLGLVYSSMGDYDKALQYHTQSQEMQHQLKNVLREALTLNSIGDCYLKMKSYSKAISFYNKALVLGAKYPFVRASNYRNIGNAYEDEGELELALKFYFGSKKIGDSINDRRNNAQTRKAIASAYIKQKDFKKAEQYLLESVALAKSGNLRAILRDSYELLAKLKENENNLGQSLYYYKLLNECEDSIQNDVEASKIASLQIEYEMQRKRLEIEGLKKDALIQHENLKQKNRLLISIAAAFVLIVGFFIYTIRNYFEQRQLSIELAARNNKIIQQRSELARQRDEAIALNTEIRAQQEEIISQRDALIQTNKNIEQLNKSVTDINQQLEVMVAKRTQALTEQNKRLEEYALINATKLMEPAAKILKTIDLLSEKQTSDKEGLVSDLKKQSENLDKVIRSIGDTLQLGLNIYENQKNG